jgi:hypothetical protein
MRYLFLLLASSLAAVAEPHGFSPTHPFGISHVPNRQVSVSNPHQNVYTQGYGRYSNYNYYYGPYGVYSSGYARPQSANYKDNNHDRLPKSQLPSDELPTYNSNNSRSQAPPGY